MQGHSANPVQDYALPQAPLAMPKQVLETPRGGLLTAVLARIAPRLLARSEG